MICEIPCNECPFAEFEDVEFRACDEKGNLYTDYVGQWVCHNSFKYRSDEDEDEEVDPYLS